MKCKISKTNWYRDDKPCEEAFKHPHEEWETRTCSEKEFNKRFASKEGTWRSKGKNHSITEKGYITRQVEDTMEWTVEINSLDELMAFCKKYGEIVIIPGADKSNRWEIEIHDD